MREEVYRRLLPMVPYVINTRQVPVAGLRGYTGLGQTWSDIFGDIGGGITTDLQAAVVNLTNQGINALDQTIAQSTSGSNFDPVPMENWVNYNVLKPVSDALQITAVKNDLSTLQALFSFITTAQNKWYSYLQAHWGSAAQNSYNRLIPYFNGLETALNQYMSALGGAPAGGTIPGTGIPYPGSTTFLGFSPTTLLLLGVGAYFILKRKG